MEDERLLAVSGVQHFAFCPRQWALIHTEQIWQESKHTAEGRLLHDRTHDPLLTEKRCGVLVTHAVPLVSHTLGLVGEADVVEYTTSPDGILHPYPVEYKRGRPKVEDWDRLQLCAQAMCLEEMLKTHVNEGALFYWQTRHRETIKLTENLRTQVSKITEEMHKLAESGLTPSVPQTLRHCKSCSLADLCLPRLGRGKRISSYIAESFAESFKEGE